MVEARLGRVLAVVNRNAVNQAQFGKRINLVGEVTETLTLVGNVMDRGRAGRRRTKSQIVVEIGSGDIVA